MSECLTLIHAWHSLPPSFLQIRTQLQDCIVMDFAIVGAFHSGSLRLFLVCIGFSGLQCLRVFESLPSFRMVFHVCWKCFLNMCPASYIYVFHIGVKYMRGKRALSSAELSKKSNLFRRTTIEHTCRKASTLDTHQAGSWFQCSFCSKYHICMITVDSSQRRKRCAAPGLWDMLLDLL